MEALPESSGPYRPAPERAEPRSSFDEGSSRCAVASDPLPRFLTRARGAEPSPKVIPGSGVDLVESQVSEIPKDIAALT